LNFDILSNSDIWAIDCIVSDRDIKVGILAVRSPRVKGTIARLYAHDSIYYFDIDVPLELARYSQVLPICQKILQPLSSIR
jgi:hypothetical protein